MKKLLTAAFISLAISSFGQIFLPQKTVKEILNPGSPNPTVVQNPQSNNNNVGINESNPAARLHISDDASQANCQPALLIEGNAGSNVDPGGGPVGPEEETSGENTCTTPYAIRVYENNGSTNTLSYNLAINGVLNLGSGIDAISTNTTVNAYKNLGAYGATNNFLKLDATAGNAPAVQWNSNSGDANLQNLEFTAGSNVTNLTKAMSLSPNGNLAVGNIAINPNYSVVAEDGLLVNEGRVGIGTATPETALHIVDQTEQPNGGNSGQLQGLLIENQGWRNHDMALEIRTGQRPEGAAMSNGRVFSVSNAGTVHIGPKLNWIIPDGAFKLWVEGGIRTERVRVDVADENGWADYVFEEGYKLMPTKELEAYIKKYKHLPGVPSAKEAVAEGIDLAEMNKILLEKIEELTLRVIELEKNEQ